MKSVSEIEEFKKELAETRQCLELNQKQLFQRSYIPFANGKALMKAKLIHTNEIFAYVGDSWFIKTSADRAIKISDRRIQSEFCFPAKLRVRVYVLYLFFRRLRRKFKTTGK